VLPIPDIDRKNWAHDYSQIESRATAARAAADQRRGVVSARALHTRRHGRQHACIAGVRDGRYQPSHPSNRALRRARQGRGKLLLDGTGVFIYAEGTRKSDYSSCHFRIWASSPARADETSVNIFRIVGERRIQEQMFVLDWHFANTRGGISSTSFEEVACDVVHDEAYPGLGAPVKDFITRYLDAKDTVLILLGQPGSGKTRFVRAILGEMSRRKGQSAEVMYTGDKRAFESDEIFVSFITGSHDAFVVEDADHLLTARSSGNQDIHRFLAVADGVVSAQGRKILFTTNLPNIHDIDEALLRPGRCFATVQTRSLTLEEGIELIGRLCDGDAGRAHVALARAFPAGSKNLFRGIDLPRLRTLSI
jgi:hypothetical protein